MYSDKSYKLTEKEFNYLLPAIKKNLLYTNETHYFVGSAEDLDDMLNRLKGLYDFYDSIKKMVNYQCFTDGSLEPFRKFLKLKKK
jgi:hypothetical protein